MGLYGGSGADRQVFGAFVVSHQIWQDAHIGEVALGPLTFTPGDSSMSNSLVVAQGHLSKKSHLSN